MQTETRGFGAEATGPQKAPLSEVPGWEGEFRRRYGRLVAWLARRFFSRVEVDPELLRPIREAAQTGTVVYLMPFQRLFGYLFYCYLFARYGLPQPRFVNGVISLLWAPLASVVTRVFSHREGFGRGDPEDGPQRLARAVTSGESSMLFLRRPHGVLGGALRGRSEFGHDYLATLVRLQQDQERPIIIVPLLLLFTRRPAESRPGLLDVLFGPRDDPGILREALMLLRLTRYAVARACGVINIRRALEGRDARGPEAMGQLLRRRISAAVATEQKVVLGPKLMGSERLKRVVLRDRRLRATLRELEAETGRSSAELEAKALKCLEEIAANYRGGMIELINWILNLIWNRIYDGLVVDRAGLERVREAARRGALLLCPSHKSHIDYLIVSQVFFQHGLVAPHIAAGINLSFWPLGPIFRRAGAFFLRRSFKGDPVYTAVFRAYIKCLQRYGFPQEFFIEGGRSRTGKLRFPRTGLLSMEVEAWLDGASQDVMIVPISIGYDQLIEAGSYSRELAGGEKKKEDIGALLKSSRVLTSRYGRVYLSFDEPISLADFLSRRGIDRSDDKPADPELLRSAVTALGHQIVGRINRAGAVTAVAVVAAALLSNRSRGVNRERLFEQCEWILEFLAGAAEARLSPVLRVPDRTPAWVEALERFQTAGLVQAHGMDDSAPAPRGESEVVYAPVNEKRIELDFYKNTILNHFVAHALVAMELEAAGGAAVPTGDLYERTRTLSMVFKYEFNYRTEASFDENFYGTLDSLESLGWVARDPLPGKGEGAQVRISEGGRASMTRLAMFLRPFAESYHAAFVEASRLGEARLSKKAFIARVGERARHLFFEGVLWRAESVNQGTIEGAVSALEDLFVLERSSANERELQLSEMWRGEAARGELEAQFGRYLEAVP